MDDTVFTAETVFAPAVPFTCFDVTPEVSRTGPARAAWGPWMVQTAVASALFSCVLLVGPAAAAASDNVVRQSALGDAAPPIATWQSTFDKRVAQLLKLPEGWEPGAPAISPVAANLVRQTIEQAATGVIPIPAVVPTVEGGVQVEWHQNGADLEIRATPEGNVFAFYAFGDDEREIFVTKPRQVRRLLRQLTGR